MRDISPEERKLLEAVSEVVPVYERITSPKEAFEWNPGCFQCDHALGNLSSQYNYSTVGIRLVTTDYYDEGEEGNEFLLAMTICYEDRFFQDNKHWLRTLRPPNLKWPEYYIQYISYDEIVSQPLVYCRIVNAMDGTGNHHINNRINVHAMINKFLGKNHIDSLTLFMTPSHIKGLYLDPQGLFDGGSTEVLKVNPKWLRGVFPGNSVLKQQVEEIFAVRSGLQVKPILNTKKKSIAKQGKVIEVGPWNPEDFPGNINFTIDPIEP